MPSTSMSDDVFDYTPLPCNPLNKPRSAEGLSTLGSARGSATLGMASVYTSSESSGDISSNISMNTAATNVVTGLVISMQAQFASIKQARIAESDALEASGAIIHTPHPIGNLDHQQTVAIDLAANGFGGLQERISLYEAQQYKEEKYGNTDLLKEAVEKKLELAEKYKLLEQEQLDTARTALKAADSTDDIKDLIEQQKELLISNVVKQGIATEIIEIGPQQEAQEYLAEYITERMEKRADMSQARTWVGSDADGFIPFSMGYAYKVAGAIEHEQGLNGLTLDEIVSKPLNQSSDTFQYRTSYKAKKGAIGLEETLTAIREEANIGDISATDMSGSAFKEKYENFSAFMDKLTYKTPESCTAADGTPERRQAAIDNAMDTILRAVAGPGEEMVISDFQSRDTEGSMQAVNTLLFIKEALPQWLEGKKYDKTRDEITSMDSAVTSMSQRSFLPLAESREDMAALTTFADNLFGSYAEAVSAAAKDGRDVDADNIKSVIARGNKTSINPFFGPSDLTDDIGAESADVVPQQFQGFQAAFKQYEHVFGECHIEMQYGQGTSDRRGSDIVYSGENTVPTTRQGKKINTNALKVGGLSPEDPGFRLPSETSERAIDTHQAMWLESADNNKPQGTMPALWDTLVCDNPDILTPLAGENINNRGRRVKEGVLPFGDQRAIPRADIATFLGGMTATRLPIDLEDGSIRPTDKEVIIEEFITNQQAMLKELRQLAAVDTERTELIGRQGGSEAEATAAEAIKRTNLYTKTSAELIAESIGLDTSLASSCDTNTGRRAFVDSALQALSIDERLSDRSRQAADFLQKDLPNVVERSDAITAGLQSMIDIGEDKTSPSYQETVSSLALLIDVAANAPVPIFVVNSEQPEEGKTRSFQARLNSARNSVEQQQMSIA